LAQVDITDQNKNGLLLVFSRHGMASRLPAVLQAGADLKHTDKAGSTAIWLAISRKEEAAVEVLLQAIIAAGMDIDAQYSSDWNMKGQTLLMHASAHGLPGVIAKLLALGANIAAKDAVRGNVLSLSFPLSLSLSSPRFPPSQLLAIQMGTE
jgi:hypothetical protein